MIGMLWRQVRTAGKTPDNPRRATQVNMTDHGFTHIALPCTDLDATIRFYEQYGGFECVHSRVDETRVAWLSDRTRPFVIVFMEVKSVGAPLGPFAHLGVAVDSRGEVARRAEEAKAAGFSVDGPNDYGPPVGYWVFIRDPDGHTLELSHGQDIADAVADPEHRLKSRPPAPGDG